MELPKIDKKDNVMENSCAMFQIREAVGKQMFFKIGVLKNFTKFTGKQACNFIKEETLPQVFSCEFCKISKSTYFTKHLWTTASKICEIFKNNFFYRTPLVAASKSF